MNAGVTFERVFHALKDQVTGGHFAPGAHLEPATLSQSLNASITPVRDALHRLAGEGLVHTPRGEGFRVPHVTEVGLRHLYRWNAAVLDLAVRSRAAPMPAEPERDRVLDEVARTEDLLVRIAEGAANPELTGAIVRLNERLRAVRLAELTVLDGTGAELDELNRGTAGDNRALRRNLAGYHRRRERNADRLVAALLAAE